MSGSWEGLPAHARERGVQSRPSTGGEVRIPEGTLDSRPACFLG